MWFPTAYNVQEGFNVCFAVLEGETKVCDLLIIFLSTFQLFSQVTQPKYFDPFSAINFERWFPGIMVKNQLSSSTNS